MLHLELWCCVTKTETGFPSTECKPLHWTLINWCCFLRTVPSGDILPASNWFLVWDYQVYPVKMSKPATAFRDLKHPLAWPMQPLECARPVVQRMSASPQVCSLRISPLIVYEGMRTEAEALAAGDTSHSSDTYIYHVLKGRVQRIRRPRGKKRRTETQRGVNATERRRGEHKREANREEMRGWRRHCPCLSQQTKAAFNTLRISNYWERSAPSHCVTACGLLSCLTWGRFGKTIEKAIVREARPSKIPQQIWFPQKCTKHFFPIGTPMQACERLLVCHVFGWAGVWTGVLSLPGPSCIEGIKAFVSVQRKWLWT